MEYQFKDLETADLIIDAIYKGGAASNISAEPFHHLFPKCGTSGGFRKVNRADGSGKPAYVILYSSMQELEWPDYLDEETGVFRYYGDNRLPGREITDTKLKGNELLEKVFDILNSHGNLSDIPPFFVFKKIGIGRDVQFLGVAAPGNPKISPDKDLVAFWRTLNGKRFQNYEAYFSILNTGSKAISREWLQSLIYDHANSYRKAPAVWRNFLKNGREGIVALKAKRIFKVPSRYDQLQSDNEGNSCLSIIRNFYRLNPTGFETCATKLIEKMDPNFLDFSVTRPWRDGGRDAIGYYAINAGSKANYPLRIDCALEAKCYDINNSVGVKQMSRLISRIRYRQFGIMVTTSYVDSQAYREVIEDGHPILIITAADIAGILRKDSIYSENVEKWLFSIDDKTRRMGTYSRELST
jgi:hypothetical protein